MQGKTRRGSLHAKWSVPDVGVALDRETRDFRVIGARK